MSLRVAAALAVALVPSLSLSAEGSVERGEYLARIMDCGGCHTPMGPDGEFDQTAKLSGGTLGFELPGLGIFWPPNLTSDETGLGGWSDEEIATAIRTGHRPDGRVLAPIMPYHSYSVISDGDLADLIAYLRSIEKIENTVPEPVGPDGEAQAPFFRITQPE